jgi:hypothetical protein
MHRHQRLWPPPRRGSTLPRLVPVRCACQRRCRVPGDQENVLSCLAHVLDFLFAFPYGDYLAIGHRCEFVLLIKEVDDPLGVSQ